jgi:hypothetical protein
MKEYPGCMITPCSQGILLSQYITEFIFFGKILFSFRIYHSLKVKMLYRIQQLIVVEDEDSCGRSD